MKHLYRPKSLRRKYLVTNLHHLGSGSDFLDTTVKGKQQKKTIEILDFLRISCIKNHYQVARYITQMAIIKIDYRNDMEKLGTPVY